MGFLVSPGVEVNEIDLTNVIPAVSTSIGGYAGHFNWGPSGELVNISSEKDLQSTFGTPTDSCSTSFLVAASFLKYGNFLKVSRAVPTDAANSVGGNTSAAAVSGPIGNLDAIELLSNTSFGGDKNEYFVARCPGAYGDSLKVIIGHNGTTNTDILSNFDYVPGTTEAAAGTTTSNDEIHILVIDEDGLFTGIKGSILEKYQGLSLASDAKLSGGSNYYKDVINTSSRFLFANSLEDVFANADDPIGTGAITDAGASSTPTDPLFG